jgi:DNA replication protein DnaC
MYAYTAYGQTDDDQKSSNGASALGTGITALLTLYQMDAAKRAEKQRQHQIERDAAAKRAHELTMLRLNAEQQQNLANVATNVATMSLPPAKPTNWLLIGGIGVGALVFLGGGAALLKRSR